MHSQNGMQINRLLTNICSTNLHAAKAFYCELFDFKIEYDSDWFIHLKSHNGAYEIGIIQKDHELIPEEFQQQASGAFLTLVVDNVDEFYAKLLNKGIPVIQGPELTFYGQKRLLLKDPDGFLLDVSSPE